MPRKRRSRVYWRNGRAWGDFRDYSDVGGGRESLVPEDATYATTDEDVATVLAGDRVKELEAKRRARALGGIEAPRALDEFASFYLRLRNREGKITDGTLGEYEHHLGRAVEFFGPDTVLSTVTAKNVRDWWTWLSRIPNGTGGKLSGSTIRHHLNTLSSLFRYAAQEQAVRPGYNPVAALVRKPSANTAEARWLEVHEAALFLEAARAYKPQKGYCATPDLHAIVATFLLTGGRKSEVLGLLVDDVSFDRAAVTFRPHPHRRLKTKTSHRTVPLWPQLREILQRLVFGGDRTRTGLLFPGRNGKMVKDLRKALDGVAETAGWAEGEIRTKMFRHTYCAARLQTAQRILRPGADPDAPDSYDYVPTSPYTVGKEMGHGGTSLVNRVYGHLGTVRQRTEVVEYRADDYREELGERLAALRAT